MIRSWLAPAVLVSIATATLSAQNLGDYYVDGRSGVDSTTNGTTPTAPWRTITYALTRIPRPVAAYTWRTLHVEGNQDYAPGTNGETLPIVPTFNVRIVGSTAGHGQPPVIRIPTGGTGMAFAGSENYERDDSKISFLVFEGGSYGVTLGGNSGKKHRPALEDCRFSNQTGSGIRWREAAGLHMDPRFSRCVFQNAPRGIEMVSIANWSNTMPEVRECTFDSMTDAGITYDDASSGGAAVRGVYVSSWFLRSRAGIAFRTGTLGYTAQPLAITTCTFQDITAQGVLFEIGRPGDPAPWINGCSFARCATGVEVRGTLSAPFDITIDASVARACGTAYAFLVGGSDQMNVLTRGNLVDECPIGWHVDLTSTDVYCSFRSNADRALRGDRGMWFQAPGTNGYIQVMSALLCAQQITGVQNDSSLPLHLRSVTLADDGIGLQMATAASSLDHMVFAGNGQDVSAPAGVAFEYSCFQSATWSGRGNLNRTDPRLIRPFYKLAADSPCIDVGSINYAFHTTDYEGDPRLSIGRYGTPYPIPDLGGDEYVLAGSARTFGVPGSGIGGVLPRISAASANAPIGGVLRIDLAGAIQSLTNVPASAAWLAFGMRDDSGTLPYELGAFGASGSWIWTDLVALVGPYPVTAQGASSTSFAIPNDLNLVGKVVTFQWWPALPGINAFGMVTSDGLRVTFGR